MPRWLLLLTALYLTALCSVVAEGRRVSNREQPAVPQKPLCPQGGSQQHSDRPEEGRRDTPL